MSDRHEQISRQLSYVLRHAPESVGVELANGGWVDLDCLVIALSSHGFPVERTEIAETVATNDKQRFSIVNGLIRANQGHSIPVDLGLKPQVPPDTLFHGTVPRFLPAIQSEGLVPGARHHVHLSENTSVATQVGARRGVPVVLRVDAARMAATGAVFFRSDNGVWLTDRVPPEFLSGFTERS